MYLLLLPELHLHLFVSWLVFSNAVTSDEVAADVSQLRILLSRLFDQAINNIKDILAFHAGSGTTIEGGSFSIDHWKVCYNSVFKKD